MRKTLTDLMEKHGHTGHSLEDASGVPSATTYRYLRGRHKKLSDDTIQKYARVFGVTVAQFRGYEPIQGLLIPHEEEEPKNDFPHLTREEKTILNIARRINKESRRAWLKIGVDLCGPAETKEEEREVKLVLVNAGFNPRGKDRRVNTDRRARPMYGGASYGPAKNKETSEKGQRA